MIAANRLIEKGQQLVTELDRLKRQYDKAVEDDGLRFGITVVEQQRKQAEYAKHVRARVAEVRSDFIQPAKDVMFLIGPNPPPSPSRDPLERYRREHELYALPVQKRVWALHAAAESEDATTVSVVGTVQREKPWLRFVPADELAKAERRWNERHPQLASSHYQELGNVIRQVEACLLALESGGPVVVEAARAGNDLSRVS